MSEEISWLLEVAILPGQLAHFRAVAKELIEATRNESDTLAYEWNLNSENTTCHIFERYRNSAAVLAHVQTFGLLAERFFQCCRPTNFNVYGSPSDEAKAAIADLGPVYYSTLGGFSR